MKDNYIEGFLERFRQNLSLKNQIGLFEQILGKCMWEILPGRITVSALKRAPACKKAAKHFKKGISALQDLFKQASEKGAEKFKTKDGRYGFITAIKQANQLYGYMFLWGFQNQIADDLLKIYCAFSQAIMKEVHKDMELDKVYETVRPRTIALSTIHTVHRLISTTLDLDDLIPKIARLCIQVTRSKACTIYMIEKPDNRIVVKGMVKQDKEIKPRTVFVGLKGSLDRVVKTGASVLGKKKILVPMIDEDVIGVIGISNKFGGGPFTELDKEILTTFAEQAAVAIRNARLYQEQQKLIIGSIKSLATILNTRAAPHTHTRSAAFANLVIAIADQMHVPAEEKAALRYAALLHDAGKIMVPDEILRKQERLTGKEVKIIKEHPEKGIQILKPLEHLKPVIPIILHHHERFDGTGYPKRLRAEGIPLGARIMAVADAFVAMVSKRPYRKSLSINKAVEEIKRHSGRQFDPSVVNAFLKVVAKGGVKKLLKA